MLSRFLVCALAALLGVAVIAGVFLLLSGGSWNMAEAGRKLVGETRREQVLQRRLTLIKQDMANKTRVAQAVIDEHMTLSEAVTAFRQLQTELHEAAPEQLGPLPHLKTEEEFRQAVLGWVRNEMKTNAAQTAAASFHVKPLLQ